MKSPVSTETLNIRIFEEMSAIQERHLHKTLQMDGIYKWNIKVSEGIVLNGMGFYHQAKAVKTRQK